MKDARPRHRDLPEHHAPTQVFKFLPHFEHSVLSGRISGEGQQQIRRSLPSARSLQDSQQQQH